MLKIQIFQLSLSFPNGHIARQWVQIFLYIIYIHIGLVLIFDLFIGLYSCAQGWWRQVPEGIPPKGGLPYTLLPIWMASSCEMKYSPKFIKTRLKTVKIQIKEAKLNKYIWETMFDSWSMWYPTYWTSK